MENVKVPTQRGHLLAEKLGANFKSLYVLPDT